MLCDDQVTVLSRSLARRPWKRICIGEEHLRIIIILGYNWEIHRDCCVPRVCGKTRFSSGKKIMVEAVTLLLDLGTTHLLFNLGDTT